MTVAELIAFLQKQPQDALVAYALYSDQALLKAEDITLMEAGAPRPDGWIPSKRPDRGVQTYLMFPGN